jgi:NIMA (never in mitosis gene a)-related kinase 2
VFLGENNSVKLGDFGLSKIIASHDFASTYVGTPFYMSPEICQSERYSHHSDIWSLGCIIYELASRCVPFDAKNHVDLILKIRAGRTKPLPPQYSRELGEVISWCLKTNPQSRPDTAQLLNVLNIKLARTKLQLFETKDIQQQLAQAQTQISELQVEIRKLREHEKKLEMEWHTRATLAIDQRVHEQVEAKKADLLRQFDAAVDQRAEEKLSLHLASLPASHGLQAGDSTHVRSSTPPPGKAASFATTATTSNETDMSSFVEEDSSLATDITSLSLQEEQGDDVSPLAQRVKPRKVPRGPLGRAKTYTNCNTAMAAHPSPIDVHMADPSPMPSKIAPMSVKGLGLSPRKTGQERLSGGAALRRDIFSKDQNLRPRVAGGSRPGSATAFADDEDDSDGLEDEPDLLPSMDQSPSRPSSGLSNNGSGDPFKMLGAYQPKLKPRPTLSRQKTMPVNSQPKQASRTNLFGLRAKSPHRDQENRPPSSHARTNSAVPVISTSPKRTALSDPKALTPSRKAPPPPSATSNVLSRPGPNITKEALQNNIRQSPVRGRTLVELQQARSQPNSIPNSSEFNGDELELGSKCAHKVSEMPISPMKWHYDVEGDGMPSPFIVKKVQLRPLAR